MWIVATRGTALALVVLLGVVAAGCGAATVAESTGASPGSPIVDDGALPVREQLTYSLPVDLRDLAGFGDSVVVADLLRVEASYRIVVDEEEDTSSAEERVGLVFEIKESLFGPELAAEITVEAAGYQIDPETMERLAILVVDGVSLRDSWKPGDRYVLAVADTDLGFRFRSYALVARVLDDDTLARISTDSVPSELDGIARLGGLRQFFVALAADG